MKKLLKTNQKRITVSILIAILTTFIYISLKIEDKIFGECPTSYLNPGQYFVSCNLLFHGLHYFIVFISIFIISFYIMKKFKILKK